MSESVPEPIDDDASPLSLTLDCPESIQRVTDALNAAPDVVNEVHVLVLKGAAIYAPGLADLLNRLEPLLELTISPAVEVHSLHWHTIPIAVQEALCWIFHWVHKATIRRITHIPYELFFQADRLTNLSLDRAGSWRSYDLGTPFRDRVPPCLHPAARPAGAFLPLKEFHGRFHRDEDFSLLVLHTMLNSTNPVWEITKLKTFDLFSTLVLPQHHLIIDRFITLAGSSLNHLALVAPVQYTTESDHVPQINEYPNLKTCTELESIRISAFVGRLINPTNSNDIKILYPIPWVVALLATIPVSKRNVPLFRMVVHVNAGEPVTKQPWEKLIRFLIGRGPEAVPVFRKVVVEVMVEFPLLQSDRCRTTANYEIGRERALAKWIPLLQKAFHPVSRVRPKVEMEVIAYAGDFKLFEDLTPPSTPDMAMQ